ncbi:hypothetical protein K505DRAFT_374195 [Melanomma pulvis-pyrius CBS 109.77]|uniref:DUF7924 domain-containing protein n=1 Tax=Melanomma pulvis-pyrius CBS 109.77 TaxID=1314802 RepID=A0A6A6XFQ2_9PLEO|nr:hypothetical protein K505DRAFT_374195 [Melanomma pulvis-pyrius CBS 109.77]
MPVHIEKHDKSTEEPPPPKKRVSADVEVARSCKRQRHLNDLDNDLDGPQRYQPIPIDELIDHWFDAFDWSRGREMSSDLSNQMLQLPDCTRTNDSRKSTASTYDIQYREFLQRYNIYIMRKEPDPKFMEQANNIVSRRRDTPELDDAAVGQLRATMRALQDGTESEIRAGLGAYIIPGYNILPDEKLRKAFDQIWTGSIPVPLNVNITNDPAVVVPLPKPKPDMTFGYSTAAFNPSQLSTIDHLTQGWSGPSFVSPLRSVLFPFFVIEFKAQATDGSVRVARNQAAGAGAIALNGILEFLSRNPSLGDSYLNQPLFFSLTMDHESACLNAHWIGKCPDTNQHTFHLEELKALPLRYNDNIHVLQRAIKNIFDYAVGPRLKPILDALDEYSKNMTAQRTAESSEETRNQVELHVPPSPAQPPPPRKKKKTKAVAPQSKPQLLNIRTRHMAKLADA